MTPRSILRAAPLVAIPAAVFGAALALLSLFHTPYATWLQVEAPGYAVAGSMLGVRIALGQVPEPSVLAVGLYRLGKDQKEIGRPAHSPSPSVESGGSYWFRFDVGEMENLALLQLVIYLSPTGDWQTRTHAANSELIPLRSSGSQAGSPVLRKIRTYSLGGPATSEPPFPLGAGSAEHTFAFPRAAIQAVLLSILAAGALACLVRSFRPIRVASTGSTCERLFWRGGAPVLLLLGVSWELFHLEERISRWGRGLVSGLDLYNFRQSYQKFALALLAAGVAAVLVLASRAVSRNRDRASAALAGIALAGYLSLSLASALSFHFIDSMERISLDGASLVDLGKAACAAAVLFLASVKIPVRTTR